MRAAMKLGLISSLPVLALALAACSAESDVARESHDSELGVAVGLFYGGGVVGTLGPSDAARRQSPPPRARSRSGLVETRGNARETSSFNSRRGALGLEALPPDEGATVG